jgi:hypothetical protein
MNSKGVSEIVGFALIFGIVIVATAMVFSYAYSMVDESKEDVRFESMVQGFRKIQDAVESVVYGKSSKKEIRVLLSGGEVHTIRDNSITIKVTINNSTALLKSSIMGGVEYSYPDYTISFENGGVWLKSRDRTTMISQPRIFIYKKNVNNETIVFIALTSINGSGSAGGEGMVTLVFDLSSAEVNVFNQSGYIEMNINSSYVDAWKRYFDELRGYSNNTVLQTDLTGNMLNVSMYFNRLVLANYNINARIE